MLKNLLNFRNRTATGLSGRSVEVGWLLQTDKAGFIWDAPRQFRRQDATATTAKTVQRCPAVLDYEARFFEITCPIDAQIRFRFGPKGQPELINAVGEQSAIRAGHLRQMIHVVGRNEWRHPDRPVIQIITPYTFICDEPVWLNQMPPLLHFRNPPLPGVLIGGRMPAHLWPRQLMWAFEWHDIKQDLVLKRGEPWFYVRFETADASRPVKLVEAEHTPELQAYMAGMAGVTNYVKRTYSLFKTARERRPAKLLKKKASRRYSAAIEA